MAANRASTDPHKQQSDGRLNRHCARCDVPKEHRSRGLQAALRQCNTQLLNLAHLKPGFRAVSVDRSQPEADLRPWKRICDS